MDARPARTESPPLPPEPAILLTEFDPQVRDGSIVVELDGRLIVREDLWIARTFRRKAPRAISVYSQISPGQPDVKVIVSIPSLGVLDTKIVRPQLRSGKLTRMLVTFDPASKTIAVDVS